MFVFFMQILTVRLIASRDSTLCFIIDLQTVKQLDFTISLKVNLQSSFLFYFFFFPPSVPPSELIGLCGLAKFLILESVLKMKEMETHTRTMACTHRLVLLATLTFSGRASLFQFCNEMGTFEAMPLMHH